MTPIVTELLLVLQARKRSVYYHQLARGVAVAVLHGQILVTTD
jgi:hypothetical protein